MSCPFFDETSVGKCFACRVPYIPTLDEMQFLCYGFSFDQCPHYALQQTGEVLGLPHAQKGVNYAGRVRRTDTGAPGRGLRRSRTAVADSVVMMTRSSKAG